ncbi:Fe(3+) ABC transporter substrate-binding protein [Campylobacter sp. MG1]|uniref:Fe(3+) ABC transporter substrate-binding protein n=1 Tax=Campylobacter sp. MG1 TaxID=2976332 RepID=UPI00226C72BA|nr:Fe(3+) ABC transporter substrate-binding protein [Campylobacter sp. MG1]
MKKLALTILTSSVLLANGVVNVYTSRHYDSDKIVFDAFTAKTGIKVNLVQDKIDPLITKLEQEGKDTQADLFMTVGAGDLYKTKSKGLLQPYSSKIVDEKVPAKFSDKDKTWAGVTYRARVFVYDPKQINEKDLSTYEALADEKFKGKVLTRSSTASYNRHLIAFMIAKDGLNQTQDWAKKLVANFAREPKGNDRDQAKAIVSGTGAIAIMNSYYLGRMSVSKDPIEQEVFKNLKIFFPNQNDGGTHINISGAGITKYAKNVKEATALMEFLVSKEAQEILAQTNYEFPVNSEASPADVVKSWGEFKASEIDFNEIAKNLETAQVVADKALWK